MSDDAPGPIGTIEDCARCYAKIPRAAPVPVPSVDVKPMKPRKPRSKGKGSFCVLSHKGRTVHCYEDQGTAERVASAFTKRGRAGTKFTVEDRRKTDF